MLSIETNIHNDVIFPAINKHLICGENPLLNHAYDHFCFLWTNVDVVMKNIAFLYSLHIIENSSPAIVVVMREAFLNYADVIRSKARNIRSCECLFHFVTELMKASKKIFNISIIDRNTSEYWSLQDNTPFSMWKINRTNLEVVENTNIDNARLFYEKVIPKNMKLSIGRFGHETSIFSTNSM